MDVSLTKDAEKMLCIAYAEYRLHRKEGMDKTNARSIRAEWLKAALPKACIRDIKDNVAELTTAFSAKMYMDGGFYMTDGMIVYMENRFPNGIKQVVETLSTISGIVTGAYGVLK